MPSQPGVIRRFFRALWDALNFTRRLVFNLVFLLVLLAFFGAFFASRPLLAPRTALVLDPSGAIVEQYSTDPTQRALSSIAGNESPEVQLRDLLRVIDAAAKDARIERIVLIPDEITGLGLATARELGAALDRFKAGGKEVIAVSAGMGQNEYLLAAHANRILLDPEGAVLLEGFANYRSYYKDALDKLGVQVHLIKVGTFKSAAEPYVLNQASDAAKEADAYWMGGIWQEYLGEIAALRKIDAAVIADDIAHYDERVAAHDGDLARLALEQKLVDQLATRAEVREQLRSLGAAEGDEGFRQVGFRQYLATLAPSKLPRVGSDVAVIVAQGEIVPGERPPGMVGGKSTAQLVRAAREDDGVKAIVLRVNSPGGDAYSSEQIRRELAQAREAGKPVVVSMGDVAASGGYWISMASDEIWAEPNTITGSIGIFGLVMTVPDTLAKLGIHTDGVGTTPLAGTLDIRRPLSPQLEAIITSVIKRGYGEFIGKVAQARGKTPAEVDAIAQGRVWSGAQAKERGLVDKLGGLDDAIAAAASRAKLGEHYQVRYIEREMTTWERLALSFSDSEAMVRIARWTGFRLPAGMFDGAELRQVAATVESLRGKRYGAFAHCFCELH
ncbi:signal peptide peptidase SppA [Dokdonella fugitiva]|jgi:protease-4|uniref:signal peptide peptidase SppA n=1 Tax=Dokdonella fugitiva TaxID=328517 RepID=UPI0015F7AE1D|nr:signal peptide peptidase SppA [Dokdonella fugitiva]MBA8883680.1 protease-4 [Dokdonella fugitiva]